MSTNVARERQKSAHYSGFSRLGVVSLVDFGTGRGASERPGSSPATPAIHVLWTWRAGRLVALETSVAV